MNTLTPEQIARVAAAEHLGGYGQEYRSGNGYSGQFYRDAKGSFEVRQVEHLESGKVTTTLREEKQNA